MIESILPPGTAAVDTFVDPPGAALYAEEEALVRKAVAKRRNEFTTARWCARQAMARLGRPPAPVLPGPRGEPLWPAGLVGSITHCAGYRAAVLAESSVVRTIGIDAEPDEPLTFGVLEAVALPAERKMLTGLAAGHPRVSWDRLLFSAKESVYKAWFPLTSRWLDFEDAELSIDPVGGTFRARLTLTAPGAPRCFDGRWLAAEGLILTSVAVPA
ncbi:4'-phosphopantetheinyl transferase family protein [Actinoplanes siamensis]|uniref:4'-phosphopantetheinyl transferase n=1 Tax=Actinoplanes siamensis TaxID=1223317 RepID=A0A919N9B2_9ACTN|nr:4'-phosphopantetheinyl transferase superfamily protein [Actinoplanes siamensis]GIF06836.1 putative 4'-phosphopantetheinyl transferase [Actinoplanes siamensis]